VRFTSICIQGPLRVFLTYNRRLVAVLRGVTDGSFSRLLKSMADEPRREIGERFEQFFRLIARQAPNKRLFSDENFTLCGTLVGAWATEELPAQAQGR
jgi:hypothetical protein